MNTIEKDLERRQEDYKRYNEEEFKKNKININVRLNGDNKYYHAFQCALFTENLLKYGYDNITKEEIKNNGISFDNSVIVKKESDKIFLDKQTWNYSVTTSRYRNIFLDESTKETQKKIDSGEYILTDLN